MRSNHIAFKSRLRIFIPIATKLSGAALQKYDQQKIALAVASSGIAVTLLNGGQMNIQHSSCAIRHSSFCRCSARARELVAIIAADHPS
ncbi:hypothetical protein TNCV_3081641 [Trichonephila clavipes]|nr:hypothetical protein TNCV_3081641 [Trichonephila clavipes]